MDTGLVEFPTKRTAVPLRPASPAPSASASYEERAEWSEQYVSWFIALTPQEEPLPPDVTPTHRYEVEFSYCVLDPQRYEQETHAELAAPTIH